MLKNPQIVFVLEPRHGGERAADGGFTPREKKCGGRRLGERLRHRGPGGFRGHVIQLTRVSGQVSSKNAYYSKEFMGIGDQLCETRKGIVTGKVNRKGRQPSRGLRRKYLVQYTKTRETGG